MAKEFQLLDYFDDPIKGLDIWAYQEVDSLGQKTYDSQGGHF